MKRDMDLVRKVLLAVEERNFPEEQRAANRNLDVPGHSWQEISYHVRIMTEAGIVTSVKDMVRDGSMTCEVYRPISLTWAGHEFLDAARNDTVWNAAKDKIGKSALSVSFEVFKGVLTQVAKAAVGLP